MITNLPDFSKIGEGLMKEVQTIAEVEMMNFVMASFENQGFTDASFELWEGRKDDADPGRAILVKSATLRDSVHVSESSTEQVVLTASAKHAAIHNEGGIVIVAVSKKMRKYFWYMYKTTRNEKFRGMALTKKTHFNITMPKRQYMGDSITFNAHIENLFFQTITQRFKNSMQ